VNTQAALADRVTIVTAPDAALAAPWQKCWLPAAAQTSGPPDGSKEWLSAHANKGISTLLCEGASRAMIGRLASVV
jgi:hypothetical protein